MAVHFRRRVELFKGRVDLTPLIDVVFQLLIFFMLSSSFVIQPGIGVDLPQSRQVAPARRENLVVTLTREGQTFFNNRPVARPNLKVEFERVLAEYPDAVLIVQADRAVSHGEVVSVMSMAREAGVRHLTIATRPVREDLGGP